MRLKLLQSAVVTALALGASAGAYAIDDTAMQNITGRVTAIEPQLISWRRDIHQHPELSGQETRTSALVAAHLKKLGYEVKTGVGGTGVVGILKGGKPGKVVALRADMDALPVKEMVDLPFASKAKGTHMGKQVDVAHACGHDGHTAILMAVAEVLAGMKDQLPGTVKLIFQPAEEGLSAEQAVPGAHIGAAAMIDAGVMDNPKVDAVFGLHLSSGLPAGVIGYRSGPVMASADTYTIKVTGKQTHGAIPWGGIDPIVSSAQIVLGLQTIISRQTDLTKEPAVVTVGTIHGGNRENIVPDSVEMMGTVRTFDDGMRDDILRRMSLTATSIAQSSGARADMAVSPVHYSTTVNNDALTQKMLPTLGKAANGRVVMVPKVSASEDFSEYQKKAPGLFFFVGSTAQGIDPKTAPVNHSPLYQVDESALPVGARALSALAVDYLSSN
ncbi:amidohydrolase [Undibacterium sp. TJN25]|uniref:amidohydrolase n=1 Tax=Undibacterium sp. TJN25 TaxID=3413056 RepID=UPI003BF45881